MRRTLFPSLFAGCIAGHWCAGVQPEAAKPTSRTVRQIEGWTVRIYVPYGTEWYPYYMRRLAERPQNALFILFSVLNEGRGKKA